MNNDKSIVPRNKRKESTVVVVDFNDWRKELRQTEKGTNASKAWNYLLIFRNDPELKDKFKFDLFKHSETVCGPLPWHNDYSGPRMIEDRDDACIRNYMDNKYGIRNRELINDALSEVIMEQSFHPIRDYLHRIQWDGVHRLDALLIKYLGAADTDYTRNVTRKAFTAAVARVMEPGCKFDYVLTLIGEQGLRKSTLFRLMGQEWFLDSPVNVGNKDAFQTIQGSWIVELAEMSALKKKEVEEIKAFITSQIDDYRPTYGHRNVKRKRQCVFFGTSNNDQFLKDETGSRRFWPVGVSHAITDSELLELASIVDQLWAEAKYYYDQGEMLYLTPVQEAEANEVREAFTETDPRSGMVEEYLNVKLPFDWKNRSINKRREFIEEELENVNRTGTELRNRVSAIEIYCECYGKAKDHFQKRDGHEINSIMRQLKGWEPIKTAPQHMGAEYGKQRCFGRIQHFNNEPEDLII